jgi:hypothetical protein
LAMSGPHYLLSWQHNPRVHQIGASPVNQVGQLVDMFAMSGDKVSVVRLMRSSIVDRKNAYQLLSKFDFSTDKEQVRKLLEAN